MRTLSVLWLAIVLGLPAAAHATPITYTATLTGPAEFPPNASPGTGFATIIFDPAVHSLEIDVTFSGLLGTTAAAHIHCCTTTPGSMNAGVVTQVPSFVGFPLGVTAGTYDHTFDLLLASSWNPAFLNNATNQGSTMAAELALLNGAAEGRAYLNIHTNLFPGGEIRGFLTPVGSEAVPEPASLLLLGTGLAGAGLRRWRKRRITVR